MKLQYLIQQLYHEPSLITPEAHSAIRHLLEQRLDDAVNFDPEAAQRKGEYCGEKVDLPSMTVEDGIAYIPVAGAIGQKLSGFAKYAGGVDVLDVQKDIEEAEADKHVDAILFEVDSPGGMVMGTPELADRVEAMKKPKMVFSDGLICSAAYWFASAADGIFTTRTANVGSIGVYLPVFDETKYFEQMGVKVELIKAGKLKGIGFPGTSLSEAGREYLQERVNAIYSDFKAQVLKHRRGVSDDTMQGQTFMGPQAQARGLVDGIVKSKADVVAMLKN